jgi:hypothetical protein
MFKPDNPAERQETMMRKKQDGPSEIVIEQMMRGAAQIWIKGTSPLIFHAMSAKVKAEILTGGCRKNSAEKAATLRHYPREEYRESVYARIGHGPTRLIFPAVAFKCAAVAAVRHLPTSGTNMTQMKQLLWVVGDSVDVYGVPQLHLAVTRQAGLTGAPDVRSRAILPEWCCCVSLRFIMPTMNETSLVRLLDAAGQVIGIGDFRQEKGAGNYGQFQVVEKGECAAIIKAGGIKEQDAALAEPGYYDHETEQLMAMYDAARKRLGK